MVKITFTEDTLEETTIPPKDETTIPETPKKNKAKRSPPKAKPLTFEEVIFTLIELGEKSRLSDNKRIVDSLQGSTGKNKNNLDFQSKRIKDAIRLLMDNGYKITK
jgi:hypothetical protein